MKKRVLSLLVVVALFISVLPQLAFAEAGDWNPLTSPNDVNGELVGRYGPYSASTTVKWAIMDTCV